MRVPGAGGAASRISGEQARSTKTSRMSPDERAASSERLSPPSSRPRPRPPRRPRRRRRALRSSDSALGHLPPPRRSSSVGTLVRGLAFGFAGRDALVGIAVRCRTPSRSRPRRRRRRRRRRPVPSPSSSRSPSRARFGAGFLGGFGLVLALLLHRRHPPRRPHRRAEWCRSGRRWRRALCSMRRAGSPRSMA